MILLFLGSWRSTIIVCISIPLSILTSLAILNLLNETINVMTLGGLALAVGILVDDATVEIENIHRNFGMRKPIVRAILDGAMQIAVPAFVSTLCICIVFVPVIFLTGAARYLFTPLALAVVLAMMASYLLSRTLVPTMVRYLLAGEAERRRASRGEHAHDNPASSNGSTACAKATATCWLRRWRIAAGGLRLSPHLRRLPGAHPVPRPGLLPAGGRRPDPPARARSGRHPHRRNRTVFRAGGRAPSAASSRRRRFRTCWTTSACPTPASTSP